MKFDILQFNPCNAAVEYYKTKDTFEQAWQDCHRGDWMLWIAKRLGVDLQPLTLAKALCAKTVIHLMKDERSRNAIAVAEKFGRGEATLKELNAYAADDAYAAADDAADAADAAAYAAADDAADARYQNQLQTANICREVLTEFVFDKLK